MNSRLFTAIQKRGFSTLYNYSNPANPRVYLTVSKGQEKVGDLVFELYADRSPSTSENFATLVESGAYNGTGFHHGLSDFGISGGKLGDENLGAFGTPVRDEDLAMRHHKRGQLTAYSSGQNRSGSEFTVTFGSAPTLDGYQTVFGELVEGDSVLDTLEAGVNRLGDVTEDFTITASGHK
jgi:cyclophilin family peptidyl-prolyl cis-trans isomerase